MAKVTINQERCKGCGLCVHACPKKVLELLEHTLNAKGYTPSSPVRIEDCIACGMCAMICPDVVITVEKD